MGRHVGAVEDVPVLRIERSYVRLFRWNVWRCLDASAEAKHERDGEHSTQLSPTEITWVNADPHINLNQSTFLRIPVG